MEQKNNLWTKREEKLLKLLRKIFWCNEIEKIFLKLGIERSANAIKKKCNILGLHHANSGYENILHLLTGQEREAVLEIAEERVKETIVKKKFLDKDEKKAYNTIMKEFSEDVKIEKSNIKQRSIFEQRIPPSGSKKETACVVLSDFHVGRIHYDHEGCLVYDKNIALQRIEQIPEKVYNIIEKNNKHIDEIAILMLGDFVDGYDIFPGQSFHSNFENFSPREQANYILNPIVKMIKQFKEKYRIPFIRIITCPGNHGRMNRDWVPIDANWDTILYDMLKNSVDSMGDKNIAVINNPKHEYSVFEVKGHKGIIQHKGEMQLKTASGRARFDALSIIHKLQDEDFQVFGHFHNISYSRSLDVVMITGGSLCGSDGDDYTRKLGVKDSASQVVFFVNEEEGIHQINRISFKK